MEKQIEKATSLTGVGATEHSAARRPVYPLSGRNIVVPESRQLDLFSRMLERQGATVVRCPLMTICAVENPSELEAWLRRLTTGHHDLLVFYTGEGVTHLIAGADEIGIGPEVLTALARIPTIVRGPKPAAALRRLGLRAQILTGPPTTEGLLAQLADMALKGSCVGVQVYPGWPEQVLRGAFAGMGAVFDPVLPYRYVEDQPSDQVAAVIRAMAGGTIDLIAFTSQLQVGRLKQVAKLMDLEHELQRAFDRTLVASVGPVTSEAVAKAGGKVGIQPASNFHLKPFVAQIVTALGRA